MPQYPKTYMQWVRHNVHLLFAFRYLTVRCFLYRCLACYFIPWGIWLYLDVLTLFIFVVFNYSDDICLCSLEYIIYVLLKETKYHCVTTCSFAITTEFAEMGRKSAFTFMLHLPKHLVCFLFGLTTPDGIKWSVVRGFQ